MITGRCECGRVRFEAQGPITDFSHCHCSMCQRLHGAAFASWGAVEIAGFRYTAGEDDVVVYASSDAIDRHFCRHCGSSLPCFFKAEPHLIYLSLGTVEGDPEMPPGHHFFTASKAPWIDIADGLPQYAEWPPDSLSANPE